MKLSRKVTTAVIATFALSGGVLLATSGPSKQTKAAGPHHNNGISVVGSFISATSVVSGSSVTGSPISIVPDVVPLSSVPHKMTLKEKYSKLKIKKVSLKRYAKRKVEIRKYPTKKARMIKRIDKWDSVKVIGKIKGDLGKKWVKVKLRKKKGYAKVKLLSKVCPDYLYKFYGPKLTRSKGVNAGPSGKETYYNLPMGGVISIMRNHGYNNKYWVRSDGCKMFGKYIMIAADQRIRPLGSHVKTSLGMGIVCDTGGFIYSNSHQIDIAVAW